MTFEPLFRTEADAEECRKIVQRNISRRAREEADRWARRLWACNSVFLAQPERHWLDRDRRREGALRGFTKSRAGANQIKASIYLTSDETFFS